MMNARSQPVADANYFFGYAEHSGLLEWDIVIQVLARRLG
jgi:hypothetical protein